MSYKILVIEDDIEQSKPFVQMLQYRGYHVTHAFNGMDGLLQAITHVPDLVIVDLLLFQKGDDMDGYDVIHAIRTDTKTANVAILAWTGHFVNRNDEIRVLRTGADDYVAKDIEFGALEARIEALLRRVNRASN